MPIPAHKTTIQTLPPKFKKHKTKEKGRNRKQHGWLRIARSCRLYHNINPLYYKSAPPVHTPHSSLTYATLTLTNLHHGYVTPTLPRTSPLLPFLRQSHTSPPPYNHRVRPLRRRWWLYFFRLFGVWIWRQSVQT
jgi:hypothetical protein